MEGAIPSSLQVSRTVPMGVKAYRRRFSSPCTNVSSADPEGHLDIYPDTSTPGSFIDPHSTYLGFDLSITNTNFMLDYASFGPEGVGGAIIQEWRVYNQGSILEEILEYGTCASLMSVLEGNYQEEVCMYFSNKLKNTHSELHKNFIKPPMCDEKGAIMHSRNPFGLGYNAEDYVSSVYRNTAVAAAEGSSTIMVNMAMGVEVGLALTNFAHINESDPLIVPDIGGRVATAPRIPNAMDWPDFYSPSQSEIVKRNFVHAFGSVNKPQLMANLTNVKLIPIGMRPGDDCYSSGGAYGTPSAAMYDGVGTNVSGAQVNGPVAKAFTYRVCYQPLSGIFGRLSSKMLATMLMGPQQVYISLRLSSLTNFLKVSSDPCRRISGTIRDYVRNIGQANGSAWGARTYNRAADTPLGAATWNASTFAPGYTPNYSVPLVAGLTSITSVANSMFTPAASNGRIQYKNTGPLTGATLTNIPIAPAGTVAVTTAGVVTFTVAQPLIKVGTFITVLDSGVQQSDKSGFVTAITTPGTVFQTTIRGLPALVAQNTDAGELSIFDVISPVFTPLFQSLPPAPQYVLTTTPWVYKRISAAGSAAVMTYASENQVFYGTYLSSSVPQSKRIFQFADISGGLSSNFGTTSSSYAFSGSRLTYSISNIALHGDQIILPNEVAANIVTQAAAGQYHVRTRSLRTYTVAPNTGSATQSMILPLKVARAQQIFCVFQNNEQRSSGSALYYNSFCGYNIFANISKGLNNTNKSVQGFQGSANVLSNLFGVGYTNPLEFEPTTTGNDQFSVQLRIGNEFYPQQPLNTLAELSAEFTKTLQGWTDANFSPDVWAGVGSAYADAAKNVSTYDCLTSSRYSTAFVNAELLDDQTILDNKDMIPLYSRFGEAAPVNATADAISNGARYLCPRGYCVNNMFETPDGRFSLGFNLLEFNPSEGVAGGMYLGNNTITLQLGGAIGLTRGNWRCVVVVPHFANMQYLGQGQIIWNY